MGSQIRFLQASEELVSGIRDASSAALKALLETKHLYQRVSFEPRAVIKSAEERLMEADLPEFNAFIEGEFPAQRLTPSPERLFIAPRSSNEDRREQATILIGNVKLFCMRCEDSEVFSPLWYKDLHNELRKPIQTVMGRMEVSQNEPVNQLFALVYQCQRCKGEPEGFLIRRDGWHLILGGRSPMEHIETPSYIPKMERLFFRDAVIAMQAGKPLAALFYLRTFIEQFGRRQTGMVGTRATGDEILEAYAKALPDQHRSTMPSLKQWYDRLSEAIHAARSDEDLFNDALGEVDRHFDMRRLFRISEDPVGKAQ